MQGRWQVEEEYGFKSEVVFKKLKDGEGASGKWEDQDGNKFSELIGWLSDKKQMVSLGFGTNGAYWECNFTEVKAEHIKGTMVYRDHEGKLHEGDYMIKKISNVLCESQFKIKDSKDGKLKVYKGPAVICPYVDEKKNKYKINKFLSIAYTKKMIENEKEDFQDLFNNSKKKDDLADAYLQGIYWINKSII